jgi:hypothetical protein
MTTGAVHPFFIALSALPAGKLWVFFRLCSDHMCRCFLLTSMPENVYFGHGFSKCTMKVQVEILHSAGNAMPAV